MAKIKKEKSVKKYFTLEKINDTIYVIEFDDNLEETKRVCLGKMFSEVGFKGQEFLINEIMKFFS